MRHLIILLSIIFLSSCSSSITKLNRNQDREITRSLKLPIVEEVIEATDKIKESAPLRVKLYHLPVVRYQVLKAEYKWNQAPHVYEYDYAEEEYVNKYVQHSVEKAESMNIIDYINSNVKDPAGFQQNHKKRFLLGL